MIFHTQIDDLIALYPVPILTFGFLTYVMGAMFGILAVLLWFKWQWNKDNSVIARLLAGKARKGDA